ncbi:hypothetical protein D3C74_62550 [compost metagenome]
MGTRAPEGQAEFKIRSRICFKEFIVIKSLLFELPIKMSVQKVRFSAPRRLNEVKDRGAERTYWVREHRRAKLNSRFEVEYASRNSS